MASKEGLGNKMDRRSMVVVGELPDDFLRINISRFNDALLPSCDSEMRIDQYLRNSIRLSITIMQAQLTKNYGLTRMDPYCKLNIGEITFQTITAVNGAKNPVWNKVIILLLSPEINEFDIEIYDEKSFTPDTRFAWATIRIPERVYHGDDQNHWFPLSGLSGVDTEGQINLLFTLLSPTQEALKLKAPFLKMSPSHQATAPPLKEGSQPTEASKQIKADDKHLMDEQFDEEDGEEEIDEEEVKKKFAILKDMFKSTADDVIQLVLEGNSYDVDASINALLEMQVT